MTTPMTDPSPARYVQERGARYILPCAVLGHGGLYEYVLIDVAAARRWLLAGPAVSFLTHPLLKAALERIVGFWTPVGQAGPLPALGYHDDALCFVVEGYEMLQLQTSGDSRRIGELVEAEAYTLGLLRRLA